MTSQSVGKPNSDRSCNGGMPAYLWRILNKSPRTSEHGRGFESRAYGGGVLAVSYSSQGGSMGPMGKVILWLLGVPASILVLLWFVGIFAVGSG